MANDDINRMADFIAEAVNDRYDVDGALRVLNREPRPINHIWPVLVGLEEGMEFLVEDARIGHTGDDFHARLQAALTLVRAVVRHHADDEQDYEDRLESAP